MKHILKISPIYIFLFFVILRGQPAYSEKSSDLNRPDFVTDESGLRYIPSLDISKKLQLDGILEEEDWQKAIFQGRFLQREPNVGEQATENTQVAVLKDDQFLYIGIKCFDSEPSQIIAREMRRDARMENDDHFQMVFDTYYDKRNGFYFEVNPNGAKRDASFGDEGKSYNSDWDGIWDCQVVPDGW